MNHAQKKLNEINLEFVYRIKGDLLWKRYNKLITLGSFLGRL